MRKLLFGAAVAGVAAWFLDQRDGARRRNLIRDKAAKYARQGSSQAASTAAHVQRSVKGKAAAVSPTTQRPPAGDRLNDQGLAAKIESEIFRDPDSPKGKVSVNVEDGTAYLRGEVEERSTIDELVQSAAKVEGVRTVTNLLHLPDEPAPAKEARQAD